MVVIFGFIAYKIDAEPRAPRLQIFFDKTQQYLIISAPTANSQPINLSRQKLKIADRPASALPAGAADFVYGQKNHLTGIYLAPGERAIINFGRSPVGVSFRANQCSGYLGQFLNFNPPLSADCPRKISANCQAAAKNIPPCHLPIPLPTDIAPVCRAELLTQLTYNGCVNYFSRTPNFYGDWRIYLELEKTDWPTENQFQIVNERGLTF